MEFSCVRSLLLSWGAGRSIRTAPNGFARAQFDMFPTSDTRGTHNLLADEVHQKVDHVVSQLRLSKPFHFQVIELSYVDGLNDNQVANKLGRSRSTVRETRIAAEHYLEAKLED